MLQYPNKILIFMVINIQYKNNPESVKVNKICRGSGVNHTKLCLSSFADFYC